MRSLVLLVSSIVPFYGFALPVNDTQVCKCTPSNLCWPSDADFEALNTTLSGRLIRGAPAASVCYQDQPDYSEPACESVIKSWFSSTFHAEDPISIGWPWWANNSCPPIYSNGTSVAGDPEAGQKGCITGSYPAFSLNATDEEQVAIAIKFAKERNIRINVKATGHSFQGRSTAFGSLSIWTYYMRGIEYHQNFQAIWCPSNGTQLAYTIAAGEQVKDIYEPSNEQNTVVVVGSARTVGVIGWFSSGGHGPLSSTYGLGVDNVLEARIVTPDGKLRTSNPCLNTDLFRAIRGGGGGTFGVVTSVTMKAYPSPKSSRQSFIMALIDQSPEGETKFWKLVAGIMSEFPRLKEGGMQGYSMLLPPGTTPGFESSVSWVWTWSFDVHDKPDGTIEALFAPIAQKLQPENGTTIFYTSKVETHPNFYSLWNSTVGDEPVALGGAGLGSRLIPADSLTKNPEHLARVLQNMTSLGEGQVSPSVLQPYLVANNKTGKNGDVSVTPAWGDVVLHFMVSDGFPDSNTFEEAKPVLDRMTYERVAALKNLTPESGAYQNEADPFDPNWQYDLFGNNYPRLRKIKKVYDPDAMLWCLSCVGSEEWAEESGRLCRVPWAK